MPLYARSNLPRSSRIEEEIGLVDEFQKGFGAGVDQLQGLGGGFLALAGSAFGRDDWFWDGLEYYDEQMEEAAENAGAVSRIEDIDGVGELLAYTAYTAGNVLPSLIGGVGVGAVGAKGAKLAADKLLKSKFQNMADDLVKQTGKQQLSRKVVDQYRDEVLAGVGTSGAVAGAVGFGAVMGGGENFMRQLEDNGIEAPGIAFATGIASGALDAIAPLKALKKILPEKQFVNARTQIGEEVLKQRRLFRRVAEEGAKIAGIEGLTEATQEFVQNASVGWVKANLNPEDQSAFIDAIASETAMSAYLNAFVAGAIGGGVVGGVSGLPSDPSRPPGRRGDRLTTDDLVADDFDPSTALPAPDQVEGRRGNLRTRNIGGDDTPEQAVRRRAGFPTERDNPEQLDPDLFVDSRGEVVDDISPQARRERAMDRARDEIDDPIAQNINRTQSEINAEREAREAPQRPQTAEERQNISIEREQQRIRNMIAARRRAQEAIRQSTNEPYSYLDEDPVIDEDPQGVTWDQETSSFSLRGRSYRLEEEVRDDNGETVAIRATDENGQPSTIRTRSAISKIKRLKIEAENSQPDMQGEVPLDDLPPVVQKKIKDRAEEKETPLPDSVPVPEVLDATEEVANEQGGNILQDVEDILLRRIIFKPENQEFNFGGVPLKGIQGAKAARPYVATITKRSPIDLRAGDATPREEYNQKFSGKSVLFDGEDNPVDLPEFTEQDNVDLEQRMGGASEIIRVQAPGQRAKNVELRSFLVGDRAADEFQPQSFRLKNALMDLVASGMPKQMIKMADVFRASTGTSALGGYISDGSIVLVDNKFLESDGLQPSRNARFALAHELAHALDDKLNYAASSPEFAVAFESVSADGEVTVDGGTIIAELYDLYTRDTEVGRVFTYPFASVQKQVVLKPASSEDAMIFLRAEVFAQAFSLFISNPRILRDQAPLTFAFMQKLRRDERILNYGQNRDEAQVAQPDDGPIRTDVRSPAQPRSPPVDGDRGAGSVSGGGTVPGQAGDGMGGETDDPVRNDAGSPVRTGGGGRPEVVSNGDGSFAVTMPDGTSSNIRIQDNGDIVDDDTGDVIGEDTGRGLIVDINGTAVRLPRDPGAAVDVQEMVVSTIFPTAVSREVDPVENVIVSDYEGYKNNSKFEQNSDLIAGYSNLTKRQRRLKPEARTEALIDHVVDNLLHIYDQVPQDIRDVSKLWYVGANKIANQFANEYGISLSQASGVIANLSPQKDWYMNASLAERAIDVYANHREDGWTDAMQAKANELFIENTSGTKSAVERNRAMLESIKGKSLQQLIDEGASMPELGMWARTWDQTYNTSKYRLVSPDGTLLGFVKTKKGEDASMAWGSNIEIGKAMSVLVDGSDANISKSLGQANKVRNFYNNIFDPMSDQGFVTIDTHAVAAGLMKPLSGTSTEVAHNFGTGKGVGNSSVTGYRGTYAVFEEAYRRAARERGILPREMQSITWEAVRGLFPDFYKNNKQSMLFAESAWNEYSGGKLSLEATRKKVTDHAGGFTRPDWSEPGRAQDVQPAGTSTFERGVSGSDISRQEPQDGPSDRGGRGDAPTIPATRGLDRRPEQVRDPVLQQAVRNRIDRNITAGEFREIQEERGRPIMDITPDQVPEVLSDEKAINALSLTNTEKSPKPRKETYWMAPLKDGERYGVRLDIPSYNSPSLSPEERADIVTVHAPRKVGSRRGGAGKRLSYRPSIRMTNVDFIVPEKGARAIAVGEATKSTIATIEGTYVAAEDSANRAAFIEAIADPAWTQLSMNPERSSEFYDMQGNPIRGADEMIQFGNLVIAKNVNSTDTDPNSETFGKELTVNDILYSMDPEIEGIAEKVLSRPKSDVTYKEKASRVIDGVVNEQGYIAEKAQRFVQGVFDESNRIGYLEKKLNEGKLKDGSESAYKAALWTKNIDTIMQAVLVGGPLQLKDGSFQLVEDQGGFYDIFAGYDREQLREWELWAAANRAKRLLAEDRERLFSAEDISTVLNRAKRNGTEAKYKDTLAKWTAFNRKILDLSEQTGILDPNKRRIWDKDDYVPFFRFSDEENVNDLQVDAINIKRGLSNQGLNIKQLKGGEGKINPVESMVAQITTMVDRSFKNEAMRRVVRDSTELGVMREVSASEGNLKLAADPQSDLVKVFSDGQAKVYQVLDPMLYRSISSLGGYQLNKLSAVLGVPKQVLTRGVTIDPGFMVANAVRDILSASIQFESAPGIIKNVSQALNYVRGGLQAEATGTETEEFAARRQNLLRVMASGGLAIGDFYGTGRSDEVRADIMRINSMDTTLNTQEKQEAFYRDWIDYSKGGLKNLWAKWNRVGQTFEQASRVNLYEQAIENGATHAEAVSQAADILNFSMKGDYWVVREIINAIPFLNARLQGLNVLGRSIRDNGENVLKRGLALSAATSALYMINRENEEYEQLPDYDKDLNWHFFIGGEHFRLPKPFEVGLAFATMPERAIEASINEDAGYRYFWDGVKDGVTTTLSMDMMPQTIKPLVEAFANEDTFRERRIVSGQLEDAPPELQFNQYTSDFAKFVAQSVPEAAPEMFRSPMKLEFILRGYFSSFASLGSMIMDPIVRDPELPDRPEKLVSQYPVLKRFYRTDIQSSKYADLFYSLRSELDDINREYNTILEEGRTEEMRDYLNDIGGYDVARQEIRQYYKRIKVLNKKRDLIYQDKTLSAEKKAQMIQEIYRQRNAIFREAYEKHRNFYPEY